MSRFSAAMIPNAFGGKLGIDLCAWVSLRKTSQRWPMRLCAGALLILVLFLTGCQESRSVAGDDVGGGDTAGDIAWPDVEVETDEGEVPCVPDCDGKVCGDDGCGGTCGTLAGACVGNDVCINGICEPMATTYTLTMSGNAVLFYSDGVDVVEVNQAGIWTFSFQVATGQLVAFAVQAVGSAILLSTDHPDGMRQWSGGNVDLPLELTPNCGAVLAGGMWAQPGRTVFVTVGCPIL